MRPKRPTPFSSLWGRHGLYSYSPDKGIRRASLFQIRRFFVVERQRIAALPASLRTILRDLRAAPQARQHKPQEYNDRSREFMEPNWREKIKYPDSPIRRRGII